MIGWRAAYSLAASFWLFPQLIQAQDEPGPSKDEQAPAASTAAPEAEPPLSKEPAKAPAEAAAPAKSSAKGLLGDFRIGPSVSIGVPHPLTASIDGVYADFVNASFSVGRFGGNSGDTEVEIRNWDVALRLFPFHGSFFLGAAYGKQGLTGKLTQDVTFAYNTIPLTVPTTLRIEVESSYLTPQMGWFARWDSGFTLGFDFGVQIPSGATTELQTSFKGLSTAAEAIIRTSKDYTDAKKTVEDLGKTVGETAIPYINILKMGWIF